MARIEKDIEHRLKQRIEAKGGLYLKMDAGSYSGIPDRLIIIPAIPHPWYVFVELKRPKGGRVSAQQLVWANRLQTLGAAYRLISSYQDIDNLIQDINDGMVDGMVDNAVDNR